MENQFWAVAWAGLWEKKGLGHLWATFEARFFTFPGSKKILKSFWKHHSVRTEKLHWKKVKKNLGGGGIFFSEKPFFRAKNATVGTLRSETDYCWLYCVINTLMNSISLIGLWTVNTNSNSRGVSQLNFVTMNTRQIHPFEIWCLQICCGKLTPNFQFGTDNCRAKLIVMPSCGAVRRLSNEPETNS